MWRASYRLLVPYMSCVSSSKYLHASVTMEFFRLYGWRGRHYTRDNITFRGVVHINTSDGLIDLAGWVGCHTHIVDIEWQVGVCVVIFRGRGIAATKHGNDSCVRSIVPAVFNTTAGVCYRTIRARGCEGDDYSLWITEYSVTAYCKYGSPASVYTRPDRWERSTYKQWTRDPFSRHTL